MARKKGTLLSEELANEVKALVDDLRRNPPRTPATRPRVDLSPRPPVRGILLADLPSEGQADMAITTRFDDTTIQEVSMIGVTTAVVGGTFTLTFRGQTTTPIKPGASNTDVQTALEALSTIGKKNVTVALGNQKYTNDDADPDTKPKQESPGLWLVTFTGIFAGQNNIPLLTATSSLTGGMTLLVDSTTHWGDTGIVETANAVVPVGVPTPMRMGAVVLCIPMPGIGYVVTACECRDFDAPYGFS
jgi:hypothetical protein